MSNEKLVITSSTATSDPIEADGRDILITGNETEVQFIGRCGEVRLIGTGHKLIAEEVEALSLQGSENVLKIEGLGSAKIRGEDNQLEWKYSLSGPYSPSFDINGEGNGVSMRRD